MNIKFLIITLLYLCALLVIHYQIKKYSGKKNTNTKINTRKSEGKLQLDTVISMEDIDGISADTMDAPLNLDKYFAENKTDFSFEYTLPGTIPGTTPNDVQEQTAQDDLIDGFDNFSAAFANI